MNAVVGASGLVGAQLVGTLIRKGEPIRAITRHSDARKKISRALRHTHPKIEEELKGVEFVQADLLDIPALTDAIRGCKHVYHTAALVSFQPGKAEELYEINAQGTANLVHVCLSQKVEKLAYVSSVAALGKSLSGKPITEETPWKSSKSNSAYSVSKYAAEKEVWRGIEEGLPAVMVNPCVILGPGDYTKGSSAIIHTAFNGLNFYPLGTNAIVDVRDVAEILVDLCQSESHSERFILAGENLSYKNLFSRIANGFGKPVPKYACPPWLGEVAWRLAKISALLTGRKPVLTRETARASQKNQVYDASKIRARNFALRPAEEVISWNLECYLADRADGLLP